VVAVFCAKAGLMAKAPPTTADANIDLRNAPSKDSFGIRQLDSRWSGAVPADIHSSLYLWITDIENAGRSVCIIGQIDAPNLGWRRCVRVSPRSFIPGLSLRNQVKSALTLRIRLVLISILWLPLSSQRQVFLDIHQVLFWYRIWQNHAGSGSRIFLEVFMDRNSAYYSAYSILVVEDDAALAGNVLTALTLEGFLVDAVYDGNMAVHALAERKFDLLVLDIGLPGKDGYQVLTHLRETLHSEVPVILLTAKCSL